MGPGKARESAGEGGECGWSGPGGWPKVPLGKAKAEPGGEDRPRVLGFYPSPAVGAIALCAGVAIVARLPGHGRLRVRLKVRASRSAWGDVGGLTAHARSALGP